MLDKYKDIQPIFYNFINLSFENNKISHAYLIEKNGVSYANDLALDLAKFFLCDGKYDERICNLVDARNYSNFIIFDDLSDIKKEQIINLKQSFSLKSQDNRNMVYLIRDASLLNKSSANSLLKFLEEPEDGIIAILLTDNVSRVIDTISSRCQIINLINNDKFDYKTIFYYYSVDDGNFDDFIDREFSLFASFYDNLEQRGIDMLIDKSIYDFNNRIKSLLLFGFYLYFDALNIKLGRNVDSFLPNISFIKNLVDNNEINDIIYKIDVINNFLINSVYNVNLNLFMDNFIISIVSSDNEIGGN